MAIDHLYKASLHLGASPQNKRSSLLTKSQLSETDNDMASARDVAPADPPMIGTGDPPPASATEKRRAWWMLAAP
jgi:hypothetical protein